MSVPPTLAGASPGSGTEAQTRRLSSSLRTPLNVPSVTELSELSTYDMELLLSSLTNHHSATADAARGGAGATRHLRQRTGPRRGDRKATSSSAYGEASAAVIPSNGSITTTAAKTTSVSTTTGTGSQRASVSTHTTPVSLPTTPAMAAPSPPAPGATQIDVPPGLTAEVPRNEAAITSPRAMVQGGSAQPMALRAVGESEDGGGAAPMPQRDPATYEQSKASELTVFSPDVEQCLRTAPSVSAAQLRVSELQGLHTASGQLLVPLSDADIVKKERRRMQPTLQESWFHQSQHYLRWDEAFLKRGSHYRTNSVAARTTATMSHTKALCLSVNIDPQLLGTLEEMEDAMAEDDEDSLAAGGLHGRGTGLTYDTQWSTDAFSGGHGDSEAAAFPGRSSRMLPPVFMWQSPASIPGDVNAVLANLGEELQEQYNTFAPQRPLPTFSCPNPRPADLGLALSEARKEAGDAKVIFHYYARGVPSPHGGTLYLMNSAAGASAYSPYGKMTLDTLRARADSPLFFIADCTDAGEIMRDFLWKREEQERRQQFLSREHQLKSSSSRQVSSAELDMMGMDGGVGGGGSSSSLSGMLPRGGSSSNALDGKGVASGSAGGAAATAAGTPTRIYEDFLFIGASGYGEGPGNLPYHPRLPSDILTSCLTTPVRLAMLWFMVGRPDLREVHPVLLHLLPGTLHDKKTPLGQLQWYFQTITECIAWSSLPLATFSRLFREDIYVAPLFRGYLLAERVITGGLGGTLSVYPPLPATHMHPMWDVWDNLVERCCVAVLSHVRPTPSTRLSTLEAREWLDVRATKWKYAQQQLRQEMQQHDQMPGDMTAAAAGAADAPQGAVGQNGGGAQTLLQLPLPQQTVLPTLRTAQLTLPNFFHEELRGVAAVVERVTQQSFRLPALLPPGLTRAAAIPLRDNVAAILHATRATFAKPTSAVTAKEASLRVATELDTVSLTRSVFTYLPQLTTTEVGGGDGGYSLYRNTALQSPGSPAGSATGEWYEDDSSTYPQGSPRQVGGPERGNRGPQRYTRGGGGASVASVSAHQQHDLGVRRQNLERLRQQQQQRLTGAAGAAGLKDEYVPNPFTLSSSTGGGTGVEVSAGSDSGNANGGSGGGGGGPAAFPFIERAPVLLQGLLVLAHREKATELVCRLVDAGAPAILQCAETNIYRIVLDRYWTRADLRFLMPSTLFIYCKSCYADPDLIGSPKQRDVVIRACVGVLQCPVNVPLPTPAAGAAPGTGAGIGTTGTPAPPAGPPGAWQHETLGLFASATGQRLLAASLLAMVAIHSDDGREACHRAGALQVCCQLLAECRFGPTLFQPAGSTRDNDTDTVSGQRNGVPRHTCPPTAQAGNAPHSASSRQRPLLHLDLDSVSATTGAEAEAQDIYVLYHLNLISLLMSLFHNWVPSEGDELGDSDDEDVGGAEEVGPGSMADQIPERGGGVSDASATSSRRRTSVLHNADYWLSQLEPLDGEAAKDMPPTDPRIVRAALRAAHPALECLLGSPVATLRGAASKAITMIVLTPPVDERTKSLYVESLLKRVYEERLPPFEGSVELRLENVGTAYVVFRYLMGQLQQEMPQEEIRDWVAKWMYTWGAKRKMGLQPSQPYLEEEDVRQTNQHMGSVDQDLDASDPLGFGRQADPSVTSHGNGATQPWREARTSNAAAAGTGLSLVEAASFGYRNYSTTTNDLRARSGSSSGASGVTTATTSVRRRGLSTSRVPTAVALDSQRYEAYLPPLSNVIRLFIEHAQDGCPNVVAHVRKVILDDFGFLQVPWFDHTLDAYGGGTPPNPHHHHHHRPPFPSTPSTTAAAGASGGASANSGAGYNAGPRLAALYGPSGTGRPPLAPHASPSPGGRPPEPSVQRPPRSQPLPPEADNPTAHRHYVASLLHTITGRYGKGGHRHGGTGKGGGGGAREWHMRRRGGGGEGSGLSGASGVGSGGGSALAVAGSGVYLRASPGTATYRDGRHRREENIFHSLVGGLNGGAGPSPMGSNPAYDVDGGRVPGGAAGEGGGEGRSSTTTSGTATVASALQRYAQRKLEPDNVTLRALSPQDATTVTSVVYASLGYLSDLLLVKQDDYDPRNLFSLDRESALFAYVHRVSENLGTASAATARGSRHSTGAAEQDAAPGPMSSSAPTATTNAAAVAPAAASVLGTKAGDNARTAASPTRMVAPLCEASLSQLGGGGTSRGTFLEAVFHPVLPYLTTVTDQGYVQVWRYHGTEEADLAEAEERQVQRRHRRREQQQRHTTRCYSPLAPPHGFPRAAPHAPDGEGDDEEDGDRREVPYLELLSCFRPTDIYARVQSAAPANVQLHYQYNPWGASAVAASAAVGGGVSTHASTAHHLRFGGLRRGVPGTRSTAVAAADAFIGTAADPSAAGVGTAYSPSTASGTTGGGVRDPGVRPLSATNVVSGVHYLDTGYNTLLCTVRRTGSVEIFSGFTEPASLRRVTTFETMLMDEGTLQHECLSAYQTQSGLLHLTAADGSVTSWDLARECLASAGYGRGDYARLPSVLAAHPYDPNLFAVGAAAVHLYDRRERTTTRSSRIFSSPLAASPGLGAVDGLAGWDEARASGGEGHALCLHAHFSGRYPHLLATGYSGRGGPVLLWDDRMSGRPLHCYLSHGSAAVTTTATPSFPHATTSLGSNISSDSVRQVVVQPYSKQLLTLATTAEAAVLTEPFALSGAPVPATAGTGQWSCVVDGQPSTAAGHSVLPLFALGCGDRIGLYNPMVRMSVSYTSTEEAHA